MAKKQDEKAKKMEQHLLRTQFPMECQELPFEDLTSEEQNVVKKCIDHEDLTSDEFTLLKKTLQRYREAINTIKPSESLEVFEQTEDMILTEKDWLDIVDNKANRTLRVNVPFNEKWYPMEFEILPLDDSRVVSTLQTHIDLFKDYSQEEVTIWSKAQQGEPITREEQQLINKMNKEIEQKSSEDRISSMNNFLASQLRLPESTSDKETRLEFWAKFPFITKAAIMQKVEDKLGLTDQSNEKLFPDSK
jgi:hypothetical protein